MTKLKFVLLPKLTADCTYYDQFLNLVVVISAYNPLRELNKHAYIKRLEAGDSEMTINKQCIPKRIHEGVVRYLRRFGGSSKLINNVIHNNSCRKSSSRSVSIRFITTRNMSKSPDMWFGNERDNSADIHYGEITYPVLYEPEQPHHDVFSKNRISNVNTGAGHATLKVLTQLDYQTGIDNIKGDALIYIHGYKTSFMSAVRSIAEWSSSSNFSGQIYLFSWPSQAKLTEYTSDKRSAVASSAALATLLTDLCANKTGKVHLFAHSMGSLAVVNALRCFEGRIDALFENVILAAPDLDAEHFADKLWPEIKQLAKHWSVYFSNKDLALMASRILNSEPRLGASAYPIEGLEFIDVSNVQLEQTGWVGSHNYHKRGSKITHDILALINGAKPRQRALIPHENNSADVWQFADSVSA